MNIAICDDEEVIREQIRKLVLSQAQECHIDLFASGKELLAVSKHYDIIFLDIQMEGIDGIETAKTLRARKDTAVLIFITGIKEYVFDAFDVSAFHYLLKPVKAEKFAAVFVRAVSEAAKLKNTKQEYLLVQTRNRNVRIDYAQILYIESRGRKAVIHTVTEVVEMYAVMRRLEEELGETFFRSHRGYLVNLAYIREYNGNSLTLHNGECIYLAKDKYNEFVKRYMRYLRSGG